MANINVNLEVELGPVCRAGLDVLDLVVDILPHIADPITRAELAQRSNCLVDLMQGTLRGRHDG